MNEAFIPFGTAHTLAVIVSLALAVVVPVIVRRVTARQWQHRLGRWLAVLLIVHELLRLWSRVFVYDMPLRLYLPLHLCGAALLMSAVMLWRRNYRLYEIAYFWGLGGSIPALLTPDLQHGFPHPIFLNSFGGHGLVLMAVMYATVVYRWRPRLRSVSVTLVATVIYAALLFPVNLALDANYLYLAQKPSQPSLIDYLGPWPWYIASLGLLTVVVCLLCYLPFPLADRLRASRRSSKV